jgi:glutamyl-tRNA synthetase
LESYFKDGDPAAWLAEYSVKLEGTDFEEAALESMSRAFSDEKGMKFKQMVGPLRACLSGRTVTPGLFEMLVLLGKPECLQRIKNAAAWKMIPAPDTATAG